MIDDENSFNEERAAQIKRLLACVYREQIEKDYCNQIQDMLY